MSRRLMQMETATDPANVSAHHGTGARSRVRAGVLVAAGVLSGLVVSAVVLFVAAIQVFGYRVIEVSSGSMEPLLRPGDLFVTRPINIADVEIGDVVLFEQGTDTPIPVTHRVTGIVNVHTTLNDAETGESTKDVSKLLQTQGDANDLPDGELVDADHLDGILWFRVPGAGRLFGPFGVQQGLLLVALIIGLAWGVYEWAHRRARPSSWTGGTT
jgi:signal peptidase